MPANPEPNSGQSNETLEASNSPYSTSTPSDKSPLLLTTAMAPPPTSIGPCASSSQTTEAIKPIGAGNHDKAWNDPPLFSINANTRPGPRSSRTKLSERVGFSLSGPGLLPIMTPPTGPTINHFINSSPSQSITSSSCEIEGSTNPPANINSSSALYPGVGNS